MDDQPTEPTDAVHPAGNNMGLAQAYQLRNLASERALALKDEPLSDKESPASRATAIAGLIKAWDIASDRLRIMRNRPLPGSLRPESKPKARKPSHIAPSEPASPEATGPTEAPKT